MGEKPHTVTVRLDAELVRLARIICAHAPGRNGKQLKLVDYLDSLVRKPILEDHRRVISQIAAQQKPDEPKRRGKGVSGKAD